MKFSYSFYSAELKGPYKETFEKIGFYATVHNIVGERLNDRMMALLKTMLNAQRKGLAVEDIVGPNLEEYCETVFEEFGLKQKLTGILFLLYRLVCIITIVDGIAFLVSIGREQPLTKTNDISGYLLAIILIPLVFITLNALCKNHIFKSQKLNSTRYSIVLVGALILVFFAAFLLMENYTLRVPVIYELMASVSYIITYKLVQNHRKEVCP